LFALIAVAGSAWAGGPLDGSYTTTANAEFGQFDFQFQDGTLTGSITYVGVPATLSGQKLF
jgi:hypothetical protein